MGSVLLGCWLQQLHGMERVENTSVKCSFVRAPSFVKYSK